MTRIAAPRLWHFTCAHAHARIGERGWIEPGPAELPGIGRVAWFTSNPDASRRDLGLTSHTLSCDRMEHLYRTTGPYGAVRWADIRQSLPSVWVLNLERNRGWASWWVSPRPIQAVLVR